MKRGGMMTPAPSYKQTSKNFAPIENPYGKKKETKVPGLNLTKL